MKRERRLRAIAIVPHVLLARPDQLDRLAARPWRRHRLDQFVVDRTPSEAAAEIAIMDIHLLRLQRRPTWRRAAAAIVGRLRADPDVDPVGAAAATVQFKRLHRRMREMGHLIERLDHFRRVGQRRAASPRFGVGERARRARRDSRARNWALSVPAPAPASQSIGRASGPAWRARTDRRPRRRRSATRNDADARRAAPGSRWRRSFSPCRPNTGQVTTAA